MDSQAKSYIIVGDLDLNFEYDIVKKDNNEFQMNESLWIWHEILYST